MSVSRLHNNKTGRPDGTFRLKFWWGGGVRRFLELQAITVYHRPFYAISYAIRHSLRRNYISAISRSWTF